MMRAILVNLSLTAEERTGAEDSLDELAGLAGAWGAVVVRRVRQSRPRPSPRTFIGRGKVRELETMAVDLRADLILFDHDLTPVQQRSLEDALPARVVDRTQIILDIFARRASSREGKLQVELARLMYRLPRLAGRGKSFSQPGAGIRTRGPGEQKLEEDRRRIQDRITKVKRQIESLGLRRSGQRTSRKRSPAPLVSLVGYTSAGKSTLFNALTRERVFTSPMMFATLDPVMRRVSFPDGMHFLLSDTVGFIRRLPVELITSFRATLEELRESNCICHVIDLSSSRHEEQAEAVERILAEIGAGDIPLVRVYNKVDLLPGGEEIAPPRGNLPSAGRVFLSAKTGRGVPDLKSLLRSLLFQDRRLYRLRLSEERRGLLPELAARGVVLKASDRPDGVELTLMARPESVRELLPDLVEGEQPC
ncbi:MAG: GTPase HflX [Candidatus Aminicenantes bacterium]|nr:GTPase HflX [Candidatus Aminicenantes bacterium]